MLGSKGSFERTILSPVFAFKTTGLVSFKDFTTVRTCKCWMRANCSCNLPWMEFSQGKQKAWIVFIWLRRLYCHPFGPSAGTSENKSQRGQTCGGARLCIAGLDSGLCDLRHPAEPPTGKPFRRRAPPTELSRLHYAAFAARRRL